MLDRPPFHKRHPDKTVPFSRGYFGRKMGCKYGCLEYGCYGTFLPPHPCSLAASQWLGDGDMVLTSVFRSSSSSPATTSLIHNPAPSTAKTTTTSPKSSNSSVPSPNLSASPVNGHKKFSTEKASSATSIVF